ncbi:hypothetical protein VTL71DRAFT_15030 [Oculimacula yallundae]|uniref:Uncharacterized protein n=1 Tax=Oculimacula yallundae TaxID=86028 RepID=A0ABR4CFE5_9HELO
MLVNQSHISYKYDDRRNNVKNHINQSFPLGIAFHSIPFQSNPKILSLIVPIAVLLPSHPSPSRPRKTKGRRRKLIFLLSFSFSASTLTTCQSC